MQGRIRAENLCKRYGSLIALDQASLAASSGECLGIFGLSGAGKSTLLRILAGIEPPDSGEVISTDSQAAISFQAPISAGVLTPCETLWLHAVLYGIPRRKRHAAVREMLTLVNLDSVRDRRSGTLSGAARKLLEVARALLSPADILLLDEPMADIDFETRRRLWEHLLRIRSHDRKTVILATSRPEDAELCDRIVLLHEGRVLADGTAAELRGMVGPEALVIKPAAAKARASKLGWTGVVGREQDGYLVVETDPASRPVELLRQISGDVAAVRMHVRGLDSVLEELIARPELLAAYEGED